MVKSLSISLAAKCQLLFGLAVLVIIAGALAVPWQRMEQLGSQQTVKAARMLADEAFRRVHQRAGPPGTVPRGSSGVVAPAAMEAGTPPGAASWNQFSLLDLPDYPPPTVIALKSVDDSLPEGDPFARQALTVFRANPKEAEFGRLATLPDKTRVYQYAVAVRLEASCLSCHANWKAWAQPAPRPPATAPVAATTHPLELTPATAPAAVSPSPPLATATWPLVGLVRVDVPAQLDENLLLLNRIVIGVAGLVGGTLAIVVFYLITSRLILQPVRVLKNTAEKVARGDLNIRSAISTGDEFQQLSETFNRMLATLQASQDQLEETNRSLDTRVGELAQSNVDLYEANRLKSEFLTNVSHELRTPLNAIIGFTDLLGGSAVATDTKVGRYVENIHTSAKQLLDLINDLLDLAKIEAGKLVLREEKVNVAEVCEAMLNFMKPLAAKKNLELAVTAEQQMPLIITDPGRFQQILYNFLSNAIKFTPNDGKVTIAARTEGAPGDKGTGREGAAADTLPDARPKPTHVRVSVSDTGPGIPPEQQQSIFEKFRQLDGSVTRHHSGTGLGLAISRELATMLGGRVELLSAPGKGATFSVIVPIELTERKVEVRA